MKATPVNAGDRFGRLTVLELHSGDHTHGRKATCRCECGTVTTIWLEHLKSGATQSCGCLHREISSRTATLMHQKTGHGQQGQSNSPAYSSWRGMLRRCYDSQNPHFQNYGGRGITVCERWLKFANFLADMGHKPKGMTLDRYPDNNGNYEPKNCRWATRMQQQNNMRSNRIITLNGRSQSLWRWAAELDILPSTLQYRIDQDWSTDKITSRKGLRSFPSTANYECPQP